MTGKNLYNVFLYFSKVLQRLGKLRLLLLLLRGGVEQQEGAVTPASPQRGGRGGGGVDSEVFP